VKTTEQTILRRYAPRSIKFDEAKPAPLTEIKAGDQLRARGQKNADGSEIAADEIVSGTFRSIAGILVSSDNATGTITVTDLATKQPVTLRITSDSQLRKLQPFVAQRIAMRLKGAPAEGAPGPTQDSPRDRRLPLLQAHRELRLVTRRQANGLGGQRKPPVPRAVLRWDRELPLPGRP